MAFFKKGTKFLKSESCHGYYWLVTRRVTSELAAFGLKFWKFSASDMQKIILHNIGELRNVEFYIVFEFFEFTHFRFNLRWKR